jgi:hypothetical protein
MRLKSFGCSFIHGTELSDQKFVGARDMPSQLTWPAHLAQHLGRQYRCFSHGGSGNLQILSQVLDQAANSNSSDVFVVGWTWIERFDYYVDNHGDSTVDPWNTILPVDQSPVAQVYYRDLHSEFRDKFVSLTSIKLAIDTLQQRNIPFVMTSLDELLFDQRWHVSPAILDIQAYIRPFITDFDGQNFLDWSKDRGYPIGPGGHPLEAAHQAAGDYMIKVFDKQNTIDRWRPF